MTYLRTLSIVPKTVVHARVGYAILTSPYAGIRPADAREEHRARRTEGAEEAAEGTRGTEDVSARADDETTSASREATDLRGRPCHSKSGKDRIPVFSEASLGTLAETDLRQALKTRLLHHEIKSSTGAESSGVQSLRPSKVLNSKSLRQVKRTDRQSKATLSALSMRQSYIVTRRRSKRIKSA